MPRCPLREAADGRQQSVDFNFLEELDRCQRLLEAAAETDQPSIIEQFTSSLSKMDFIHFDSEIEIDLLEEDAGAGIDFCCPCWQWRQRGRSR